MTDGPRDGETFNAERDEDRLNRQARDVWRVMADEGWHTLAEIAAATGWPEASISARLRDFRKPRFGARNIARMYLGDGLHAYKWERDGLENSEAEGVPDGLDPPGEQLAIPLPPSPETEAVAVHRVTWDQWGWSCACGAGRRWPMTNTSRGKNAAGMHRRAAADRARRYPDKP